MDDIFQLLFNLMVIEKEMQEMSNKNNYDVNEYIRKQNELNNTLINIIRLMIFKKDW